VPSTAPTETPTVMRMRKVMTIAVPHENLASPQ
jgi:hypothetical protein